MRITYSFLVTVELEDHPDLDASLVQSHVRDAVKAWGGSYPPDNPLFPSNIVRVGVTHATRSHLRKKK